MKHPLTTAAALTGLIAIGSTTHAQEPPSGLPALNLPAAEDPEAMLDIIEVEPTDEELFTPEDLAFFDEIDAITQELDQVEAVPQSDDAERFEGLVADLLEFDFYDMPGDQGLPPIGSGRFDQPAATYLGITSTSRCLDIDHGAGAITTLLVAPFAELRLQMPTPITVLKLGGTEFWEATHVESTRHAWIKSSSLAPEAVETSLTVLDEALNAYDFVLQRNNVPGYTCAIVNLDKSADFAPSLIAAEAARNPPPPPDHTKAINTLTAQINQLRLDMSNNRLTDRQGFENRVAALHSEIYAGYAWLAAEEDAELSAAIHAAIQSVHDDGIRTFIRVREMPSLGLLAIQGEFQGETQLVQSAYDPLLSMYTITGVYDKIHLSAGANGARTTISRITP